MVISLWWLFFAVNVFFNDCSLQWHFFVYWLFPAMPVWLHWLFVASGLRLCFFFPLVVTCKGRFWQWVSVSVTSKFYKNIHSRKNLYNIMFRWPNLTHIFGSIGYNYYCPLCACAFPALQTRWRPFEINSSGKIRKDARDCFSSAVSVCQNL